MRVLTAAIALCIACGGSEQQQFTPIDSATVLSPAFGGTWSGITTVTFQGVTPIRYQGQIAIAVAGSNATVSNVCSDGTGFVTVTGSGVTASWSGTLTCPAVAFADCPAVALTYQSASLLLSNGGATLTAQASGNGSGCGVSRPASVLFAATR